MQQNLKLKIGAAAGIATPIVAFVCISVAIASYPAFNWETNALSDLGVVSGITGPVFNSGLIVAGILGFCFATFGLYTYFTSHLGKAGSLLFAAATVALTAIGIFNENFHPTHYIVSVAFFVLAPIALFVLTLALWLSRQRRMAGFTVLLGIVAAVVWVLEFTLHFVPNVAIPETVSGLAVCAWTLVMCKKMLSRGSV
ncbi:MAG: DUF998 domain-containing protein [Candidatus Bathyarchaeota archaeon]|nr:DUF998 domain-containing protein [Candidatus Bathyarchaeota archaeon]